jgi:hypothetical protein
MNPALNHKLANPDSVVLFFEHLPKDCSEAEAADIIYFNCGLNFDPSQLSCKTARDGMLSTCLAVCTRDTVADFAATILKLYNSKLTVRAHEPSKVRSVAGRSREERQSYVHG